MARLVKHERNKPYRIDEADVGKYPVWLCGCGLSKDKPYCDSSHKRTRDEEDNETYYYDDENRVKAIKQY